MSNGGSIQDRLRELAVDLSGIGEVTLEETRSLWTRGDASLAKHHGLVGKYCTPTGVLHICGRGLAGGDGKAELVLSDYVCIPKPQAGENYDRMSPPVFFVATARGDSPVHLTSQTGSRNGELTVTVFAWDASGDAAANVSFDWHCCVQLLRDIVG